MMVDPDGHWAYRPWGTTQLWVYDKRTAYANDRAVRAGIKVGQRAIVLILWVEGILLVNWDHL